jgi:hypothetical protein
VSGLSVFVIALLSGKKVLVMVPVPLILDVVLVLPSELQLIVLLG